MSATISADFDCDADVWMSAVRAIERYPSVEASSIALEARLVDTTIHPITPTSTTVASTSRGLRMRWLLVTT